MRTDGYVVVQPWMVTDYNLKGNKLLIYALIWGFSQDEQSCFYGSTRYITDYFKLSERAVVGIWMNWWMMGCSASGLSR